MPVPHMPDGVARIACEGRYGLAKWANIFHVNTVGSGSATAADVLDLATAFHTAYAAHLQEEVPTANHLEHTKVVLRSAGVDLFALYSHDDAGGIAGDDLPAQVAKLISWHIGLSYRGGKPRTYLCGAAYPELDGVTELAGGRITGIAASAADFRTAVNAITTTHLSSVSLGMLSYFTGGGSMATPPVYRTPPLFVPYTGQSVQPRICTQRRRLGREI